MDTDRQIELIAKIAAGVASNPRTPSESADFVVREAVAIFNKIMAVVAASSKSKAASR